MRTLAALQDATDADLISEHDRLARDTVVGTAYYVTELDRRAQARAIAAADRLARRSYWLTISNTVLAALAVVLAVIALFH